MTPRNKNRRMWRELEGWCGAVSQIVNCISRPASICLSVIRVRPTKWLMGHLIVAAAAKAVVAASDLEVIFSSMMRAVISSRLEGTH